MCPDTSVTHVSVTENRGAPSEKLSLTRKELAPRTPAAA
jgi:hypothetical protein